MAIGTSRKMMGAAGRFMSMAPSTNPTERYRARIELDSKTDPAEAILALLSAYCPSVGRSDHGHVQLTLIVPADDLRQALNTSAAVVNSTFNAEILALEVGFIAPGRIDIGSAPWNTTEAG